MNELRGAWPRRQDGGRTFIVLRTPPSSALNTPESSPLRGPSRREDIVTFCPEASDDNQSPDSVREPRQTRRVRGLKLAARKGRAHPRCGGPSQRGAYWGRSGEEPSQDLRLAPQTPPPPVHDQHSREPLNCFGLQHLLTLAQAAGHAATRQRPAVNFVCQRLVSLQLFVTVPQSAVPSGAAEAPITPTPSRTPGAARCTSTTPAVGTPTSASPRAAQGPVSFLPASSNAVPSVRQPLQLSVRSAPAATGAQARARPSQPLQAVRSQLPSTVLTTWDGKSSPPREIHLHERQSASCLDFQLPGNGMPGNHSQPDRPHSRAPGSCRRFMLSLFGYPPEVTPVISVRRTPRLYA
ncbi:hypothetical protein NDU88_004495 [Pleurodeles waltl]|uniref:Uncharacterized protein n=1 Tax=Pleurodeles waltl TaxID=8319 RepID=A0AAV7VGE6_PLEWA|nr:hypothetical protein NDU88_004495 [Pleurodeles waltl]